MRNNFLKNKYALVKGVISKETCNILTDAALFDEMQNYNIGDKQVPAAHSSYANPMMESLLLNLHKKMEDSTELSLYPTYSYYRVYRTGDTLLPHVDRESCEISTSICIGKSYEEYSWPLIVNGKEIDMLPGDMVIYRGIELTHSRDEFNPPQSTDWHIQAFLHYVDANGPHAEYKFDKRKSLGIKNNLNLENRNKDYITYI